MCIDSHSRMSSPLRCKSLICAAILIILVLVTEINSECANACSGRGRCTAYDMCDCWRNFMGNDCSERVCAFGRAHADSPKGDLDFNGVISGADEVVGLNSFAYPYGTQEYYPAQEDSDHRLLTNTAHEYFECSNKGHCNRQTGVCECYDGYEGVSCQRASCPGFPTQCSGHGVCKTIGQLAEAHGGNVYKLWDRHVTMGCECDTGYSGPDCGTRVCPYGVDPLYYDDVSTVRTPVWDFAILTTGPSVDYINDGVEGNPGLFSIRYYDNFGDDWLTDPIQVGASCSTFMNALYNLPLNKIPYDSLTCNRIKRNNNVTWNVMQGKPGDSGSGDPAPENDDDLHGFNADTSTGKEVMIRYKMSMWEAGFTSLEEDDWGDEIDGKTHDGVQDIALSGYIYRIRFKAAAGGLKQPEIETYIDGKRPHLASAGNYRAIVRVWTDGQQPEAVDYFPEHCDGVTIDVVYDKLHIGSSSYPNFPSKINPLAFKSFERVNFKECLGDADLDPNNNVEIYNWDYGNRYYPHIVKLVRRVTTYTDGGYYVALYFDGTEFIFLNAFHPVDPGTYDGDAFDVYTTKGTLALTSKHAETIFGFASKTFFTMRKKLEDQIGAGLAINDPADDASFNGDLSCDPSVALADTCWRLGCNADMTKIGFDTRAPGSWVQDAPLGSMEDSHRPSYANYKVEHCLGPNDMFTALNWDDPTRNPYYINLYTVRKIFKQGPRNVITATNFEFDVAGDYVFTVPQGVSHIEVFLRGAAGGNDNRYGATSTLKRGGLGAVARARIAVTAGTTYNIKVGGKGQDRTFGDSAGPVVGGYNGGANAAGQEGAGGGGASDIRSGVALSTRIIVAGGGGGGAATCAHLGNKASSGGNGGTPIGFGPINPCHHILPDGVYISNNPIIHNVTYNITGGSQIAGGRSAPSGNAGTLGDGGVGISSNGGHGGGGGGGYYGGGGGVYTPGAGGSSWCDPTKCKMSSVMYENQTFASGDGLVRVSFLYTNSEETITVGGTTTTSAAVSKTWDVNHRSHMQTNIITSDISTNWAANYAVQNDDVFEGQYPSGFHIYKFIPSKESWYEYSAPCSNRGACDSLGICKCFPGYTGNACQTQASILS